VETAAVGDPGKTEEAHAWGRIEGGGVVQPWAGGWGGLVNSAIPY
jgi:hypothetical protein